ALLRSWNATQIYWRRPSFWVGANFTILRGAKTASAGQLQFSQIFCPLQSALAILTVRTETLFITPTRFERVLWLNSPSFEQASTSPISVNPDWGIIFGVRATSQGGFSMSGIETKELCGVLLTVFFVLVFFFKKG